MNTGSNLRSLLLKGDRDLLVKGISAYTQAIELDTNFSAQAYYNRAYLKIVLQSKGYEEESLNDLLAAKKNIEGNLIPELETMQLIYASTNHKAERAKFLNQQINRKIDFYRLQIKNINQSIELIQKVILNPEGGRIGIQKEVLLRDLFQDDNDSSQELIELEYAGLNRLFELDAILFPKEDDSLLDMLCGVFLGGMQLLLGVCACMAGHPYLGTFLIEEGISDLFYCAQCALGLERFDFKNYRANKIMSCAWNIVSLGIQVIKENAPRFTTKKTIEHFSQKAAIQDMIKEKVTRAIISSGANTVMNIGVNQLSKRSVGCALKSKSKLEMFYLVIFPQMEQKR